MRANKGNERGSQHHSFAGRTEREGSCAGRPPLPQTETLLRSVVCNRRCLKGKRICSLEQRVPRGVVVAVGRRLLRTLES